jgi:hypothetical protein
MLSRKKKRNQRVAQLSAPRGMPPFIATGEHPNVLSVGCVIYETASPPTSRIRTYLDHVSVVLVGTLQGFSSTRGKTSAKPGSA